MSINERLFSPVQRDLKFYYHPDEQTVETGTELMSRQPLEVQSPLADVYQQLRTFRSIDWTNIDEDPVIQASRQLSPSMLLSLYRLNKTQSFAAYILKDDPRVSADIRDYMAAPDQQLDIEEVSEAYRTGTATNDRFVQRLGQMMEAGRDYMLYLSAPELLEQEGLQLYRDFLSPLKLLEMEIGYDPHVPTIESRAAGLQIPYQVRSLSGFLRLAQQARAHDSLISALIQEYQHILAYHSHHMDVIRQRLEFMIDTPLIYSNGTFHTPNDTTIDPQLLSAFVHEDPVFTLMRRIGGTDYRSLRDEVGGRKALIDPNHVLTLSEVADAAYEVAMTMVDPAVNAFVTKFPETENVMMEGLMVPTQNLYKYNQRYTILRKTSPGWNE